MVQTAQTKRVFNFALLYFLGIIKNQYEFSVYELHMNNEAAFDRQTKHEINKKGIKVHATPPYARSKTVLRSAPDRLSSLRHAA